MFTILLHCCFFISKYHQNIHVANEHIFALNNTNFYFNTRPKNMTKFLRNKLSVMTILAMTTLSLAACNDDNDSNVIVQDTETPGEIIDPSLPTQSNIISGKLVSYDGKTPIANALVYVVGQPNTLGSRVMTNLYSASSLKVEGEYLTTNSATSDCGVAPEGSLASTCTRADGSYDLDIETDAKELIIRFEKGAFTAEQKITLEDTGSSQVGLTELSDTVLESVPKMVVIEGSYDSIELILARLGLATIDEQSGEINNSEFELWDSTNSLFVDSDNSGKADIYDYEIVFFNCGQQDIDWLMDDGKRQILKDYINTGGRIYVSDQAYDIVEQTFPEYIDFFGSDDTPNNQPEDLYSANEGEDGITIQSNIETRLKSWLEGVTCAQGSCLNADGTVTIKGFADGWARMNSVNNTKNVDVYASGQDSDQKLRPLTVAFNYGKGRVTYTSYHNEEGGSYCYDALSEEEFNECVKNSSNLSNNEMNVQQRILQYLVFEL